MSTNAAEQLPVIFYEGFAGAQNFAEILFVPPAPPAPAPLPVLPVGGPSPLLFNQLLAIGSSSNPNPYGVDISCVNDLDPYFSLVGGVQVLAQDLYHRITTPPGTVPGAPDFGFDCHSLLSQSITATELSAAQSELTTQLQADERVQQASVRLSFNTATETLTITATVQPLNPQYSTQPFSLVASVTTVGANLLSISPVLS